MEIRDHEQREPPLREKLVRLKVLAKRARAHWPGALVAIVIAAVAGVVTAVKLPRTYESETVVLVSDAIRTDAQDDTSMRAQRIGPKVKDLLIARSRLEKIIREMGLYPDIVEKRGMVDAVDEMRLHIGFRARDSDTFLISFQAEAPELAQRVAARLADSMIDDFVHDSVAKTAAARDFLVEEEKRAEALVDERDGELARFVAQHPQFMWDPARTMAGAGLGAAAPPPGLAPPAMAFGRRPGAVGPGAGGATAGAGITDPELAALYRERARLEAELARMVRGSDAAGGGTNGAAEPGGDMASLDQTRAKAAADLVAAQADLAEKRMHLTNEHPDVIAARTRAVAAARALQVAEEALAAAKAKKAAALRAAEQQEDSNPATADLRQKLLALRASISAREAALSHATEGARSGAAGGTGSKAVAATSSSSTPRATDFASLETDWQRLLGAAAEAHRQQQEIADKRARAALAASAAATSGTMQMTIIDPAFRPLRPVKPNRKLIAGAAAAFGLLLGLGWAVARVLLNDVVFDATDVELLGGPDVLAVIPNEPPPKPSKNSRAMAKRKSPNAAGRPSGHDANGSDAQPARARREGGRPESEGGGGRVVYTPAPGGGGEGGAAIRILPTAARSDGGGPGSVGQGPAHAATPPIGTTAVVSSDTIDAHPIWAVGEHGLAVYGVAGQGAMAPHQTNGEEARARSSRAQQGRPPTRVTEVVTEVEPSLEHGVQNLGLLGAGTLAALRLLRHCVERRKESGHSVLALTSALRGEGKSRVAAQLALALAESGRARVLLVETHFEHPAMARILGLEIPAAWGFSSQLQRRIATGRAARWAVVGYGPSLHVLAEAEGEAHWPEALHSREFAAAIDELRDDYDFVVIDGPSVLDGGHATSVEAVSDGVILVARAGISRVTAIRRAERTLGDRRLLGLVLTDAREAA